MRKPKRILFKPDGFLTVDDIAKKLLVHPQTVRRWVQSGYIHPDEDSVKKHYFLFEENLLKDDLYKIGIEY